MFSACVFSCACIDYLLLFLRGKLQICHLGHYQTLPFSQHAHNAYERGSAKTCDMKQPVVLCKSVIDIAFSNSRRTTSSTELHYCNPAVTVVRHT